MFRDASYLDDFADYLIDELGRSPKTVYAYRQQIASAAASLGKPFHKITVRDVRYHIKRDSSVALSTRQLRLAAFKVLHKWALLEGYNWADPAMLAVASVKVPRRRRFPVSVHTARDLLTGARTPNETRAVYLGLYGGLRASEAANLSQGEVTHRSLIFVGKGDKQREVPIHLELRSALEGFIGQVPASVGVLMGSFAKLRDRVGARDIQGEPATIHTLRRTFADTMYQHGARREWVAQILGHGQDVTDVYAPVSWDQMVTAVGMVDYFSGDPVQLSLF